MIGRVNGVNFSAIYGSTHATARQKIKTARGIYMEIIYVLFNYPHFLKRHATAISGV